MIFLKDKMTPAEASEAWEKYKAAMSEWHSFFPIWPRQVTFDDGRTALVCLQHIERKGRWIEGYCIGGGDFFGDCFAWKYRLPKSVSTKDNK